MSEFTLRDAVNKHLPFIDEILAERKFPIHSRHLVAADLFVDIAIVDSSFASNEELKSSKQYYECIIPPIYDWYLDKYGELLKSPTQSYLSGILTPFEQPVLIKIPTTTSTVEVEGETAWMTFPDCLQEAESLKDMLQTPLKLQRMTNEEQDKLQAEFSQIVYLTRRCYLNSITVTDLDENFRSMLHGVWAHFEKAIVDILSYKHDQTSIGCWELHLAIEKALKVFLHQREESSFHTHNLHSLAKKAQSYEPDIDLSLIQQLPSAQEAIKFRYGEITIDTASAVRHYKSALVLVKNITEKYIRSISIYNARFLIKKAPWI